MPKGNITTENLTLQVQIFAFFPLLKVRFFWPFFQIKLLTVVLLNVNESSPHFIKRFHSHLIVNTFQPLGLLFYHQNQNMHFLRTVPHSHVLTRFSQVPWL